MSSQREEFIESLELHQAAFRLDLSVDAKGRLADHFDLVIEQNPVLHLTGPSTPAEFAMRHVLESLTMLEFLPTGAKFADVGSGAGFPALPCLIVRDDLRATLIESKEKKAGFLRAAVEQCALRGQADVISKQFSETPRPDVSYISCRALDRFTQHLPKLIKWAGRSNLLFFGGPALRDEMQRLGLKFEERLMPMSEQRFLLASPPRNPATF